MVLNITSRDVIAVVILVVVGVLTGVRVMPYTAAVAVMSVIIGYYFGSAASLASIQLTAASRLSMTSLVEGLHFITAASLTAAVVVLGLAAVGDRLAAVIGSLLYVVFILFVLEVIRGAGLVIVRCVTSNQCGSGGGE